MVKDSYKDWLAIAKLDLKDSGCNYERKEYARSLFFLHEVSEKTFKALSLRIGFSSENPDPIIEKALEIKLNVPRDYGHFFRTEFINQLEDLFKSPLVKAAIGIFGINDVEKRLSDAKAAREVYDPTETELVEAIELSRNEISKMDQARDVRKILKNEDVEAMMKEVNEAFGTKTCTPEVSVIFSRLQNSAFLLAAFGPLLFLSVFLDPYFWAKYPNNLDPTVMVGHYAEIKGLLEACVNIADN